MLWEHEPIGECFHSFFEFSQTFTSVSITRLETQKTCFLFLSENTAWKELNPSFTFARAIISSTARASSVFLSSFYSINLLAFYHKCCALIGYATHYLFCDRQ